MFELAETHALSFGQKHSARDILGTDLESTASAQSTIPRSSTTFFATIRPVLGPFLSTNPKSIDLTRDPSRAPLLMPGTSADKSLIIRRIC